MADNTVLNAGTGGDTISTDDIAGVKVQRVKVQYGVDGAATDVSDTNPLPIDDAGGSITVDNAGLTELAGAINVSAQMDVNIAAQAADVTIADGGNSITVDGTITEANSAAILADTANMDTNLGTIAGAIKTEDAVHGSGDSGVMALGVRNDTLAALAGTDGDYAPLQVDASGALYVNADLTGNSGSSIGSVAVTSVITGTGATNLGKAEDAVHTTGDVGVMGLFVRQDTQADFGADGDYVPGSVDANGALRVNAINADGTSNADTVAGQTDAGAVMLAIRDDTLSTLPQAELDYAQLRVNSTGALHVTGAGGGTQYSIDDAAPTVVTMAGVIRDDTLTTLTEVDGDATALRVNSTGALHVTGGGGGTEYTEDAAAPANPVGTATMMERDDALGGITPIAGDWSHQFCNANGALWTAVDGTVTVDNGGTFAVQAAQSGTWNITNISGTVSLPTGASTAANQATQLTALQLIDNPIVAHDAAVSGSTGVNMLGFEARSTAPTAVANADAVRGIATLLGKQVTIPYAIPASTWTYASPAAVTDTADDVAKTAAGAGIRNYITGVQVFNGHDTVGTEVVIKDGTTVLWRGWAEQTGGGCSARFDPPLRGTANTAVNVANITTGSSTYFNLQGYVAAE